MITKLAGVVAVGVLLTGCASASATNVEACQQAFTTNDKMSQILVDTVKLGGQHEEAFQKGDAQAMLDIATQIQRKVEEFKSMSQELVDQRKACLS
jgi:hypothetical protein